MSKKLKATVICNGCPENRIDVALAEKYLEKTGYLSTKDWHEADIILFNACGHTIETATGSLNIIKQIEAEKKENQQLIVWGCLPKIDAATLKSQYPGLSFPGADLSELKKILNSEISTDKMAANKLGYLWAKRASRAENKFNAFNSLKQFLSKPSMWWIKTLEANFNLVQPDTFYIKASSGCLGSCSYCVIRKSRGSVKSKSFDEVLEEFKQGLLEGYKKFSLIGTDLGCYGFDNKSNLAELLNELIKVPGDYKINIRNANPAFLKGIMNDFIPVLKSNKIRYIELPVESGSNRILKLMNRNYTIEEFKDLIAQLRQACPELIIRTQLIVGFPTETEQEFLESMRLIDEVAFDYVEVYRFSDRPGALAEPIVPKVPEEVKAERHLKLYNKAIRDRSFRKIKRLIVDKM
jgi:threonylcarbamoyladenosine tRNA methylthiotransferase CDKAL1